MKVARFPLAGSLQTKVPQSATRVQLFQNGFAYANADELTGGKRVRFVKRLGYTASTIAGQDSAPLGATPWSVAAATSSVVFSFFDSGSDIEFYNQAGTQIGGTIANASSCSFMNETIISGTSNLTAIIEDSATSALELWYFPNGGAWTQVTDTDFPANQTPAIPIVGPPAHLDGYTFQMTRSGQIWNSDLNSISSWSANNFISAQQSPDEGVGVYRHKDYIVAFGRRSMEFFRNAGNPSGSPLSVVPNSLVNIGLSGVAREIGDSLYFIGIGYGASTEAAYRLTNGQIQKISDPGIEQLLGLNCLGGFDGPPGFEHVAFSANDGASINYCVSNGRWWKSTLAPSAIFGTGSGLNYFSVGPKIGTINHSGSGYQDDGSTMTMTVQLQPLDFGTNNKKYWKYLRLSGDKQSSTATVTVSYSDDDAVNFTTAGTIDMSVSPPVQLTRLGASRRRVWKFTNATNTPMSLDEVEIGYEVGPT